MILALTLAAAAPAAPVVASPAVTVSQFAPEHIAAARRVIELVIPADKRDAMFRTMMDSMMSSIVAGVMDADPSVRQALEDIPEAKAVFARFVDRQRDRAMSTVKSNMPELIEAYARAYARQFTVSELGQIEIFMKTEAGAKFAQRSASLVSDPDVRSWMRRVSAIEQEGKAEQLKQLRDELLPILSAHREKHLGS